MQCQREKGFILTWGGTKLADTRAANTGHDTEWDQFIPVGGRAFNPLARKPKSTPDNTYPGTPPDPAIFPNSDVPCVGPPPPI